jgi:hypothetical protein
MTNQRQEAPDVTLKSVVSGRALNLRKAGVPLVLVFASQATTEAAGTFRTALRERYPDPAKLIIASVVDMHAVPRLMRKMAESALSPRYREVAGRLAPGQEPRDYIVMLPDWKGEVAPALGLGELQDQLGIAVIGADGSVAGMYSGADPLNAAAELIESAGN